MTPRLELVSVAVPHGAYDINRDGKAEEMPSRACFMHPDAVGAWGLVAEQVVVSDMYRSPDSSLAAIMSGRGAADPGFSRHNYGLAIDIDVPKTKKLVGVTLKAELDAWMNAHGWWCWREDHAESSWKPRPNEAWHYDFSPERPVYKTGHANAWWLERIGELYPLPDILPVTEEQTLLAELGLYGGRIDGKRGPLTAHASTRFMRAWDCGRSSYTRTLWFVTEAKRHEARRRALRGGK